MPQEFEPPAAPSVPVTEALAAQQKVTPDEVSAALDALHERQQAPIDFDLDLSIGQVLDELDLPLPASDLWREVQELRARKAQAAVSGPEAGTTTLPASLKTGETTRRRWRLAAYTLAAVLAVSVPVLRYARVSAPPDAPPAASPAVSALVTPRPDAPQMTNNSRTDTTNNSAQNAPGTAPQNSVTIAPPLSGSVTIAPPLSGSGTTSAVQNGTNANTQTAQDTQNVNTQTAQNAPPARRLRPLPGNIINGDNQTRTIDATGGQVVVGGNGDTVTLRGRLDQFILNGNSGTVRLRGPVGQLIIGGNGNNVTYSRAFPAPQVIDNGSGNVVQAQK